MAYYRKLRVIMTYYAYHKRSLQRDHNATMANPLKTMQCMHTLGLKICLVTEPSAFSGEGMPRHQLLRREP